ncbi:DNA-protecting protein DprA [Nakamurella antarctica]|uniref:DNA-protecting protein DprA n=2 Tax=Nakamurella antarctica TaxID=1902245 RepID=A0A3G8ZYN8_9ACTN|nr:DNA-protecting protein DprA [Nakamurella antarctica]
MDHPTVDIRIARAGLLRMAEPPAPVVAAYAAKVGSIPAFKAIVCRTAPPSVLRATAARTAGRQPEDLYAQARHDLASADAIGATLLCPEDSSWPTAALTAFEMAAARGVTGSAPPIALYVLGNLPPNLPTAAVTLIGSRACSGYGERTAAEISGELAADGVVVVSGGAFGIDTTAHRAALAVDGRSVAVLACGIDRSYPVANTALLAAVRKQGAVVSEYPPGTTPARHRFLVRNRLLAALGAVTLVVEAGRRSGSLSTAAAAMHLGRVVMAVPGPVSSAMSAGCHLLIRDRAAILATCADDVLHELRGLDDPKLFAEQQFSVPIIGADARRPTDGLDSLSARIYDAIPARAAVTVQQVCESAGVTGAEALAILPVLHVHGLVERDGACWKLATRMAAAVNRT